MYEKQKNSHPGYIISRHYAILHNAIYKCILLFFTFGHRHTNFVVTIKLAKVTQPIMSFSYQVLLTTSIENELGVSNIYDNQVRDL